MRKKFANGVEYHLDDNGVVCFKSRTIQEYIAIQKEEYEYHHPETFFAFSDSEVEKKVKELGLEGQKLYSTCAGMIGTRKGIDETRQAHKRFAERVKEACSPQEVYFYEYNNHECMYDYEGDENAYNMVVYYFGKDLAKNVVRI